MGMKKKLASIVAVAAVAGAIGAAPASAAPAPLTIPSASRLSGLCASVKQSSLKTVCNQAVSTLGTCETAGDTKAVVSCLSVAARGFIVSKAKLPSSLKDLFSRVSGSGSGGFKLPNLGGFKLPNFGSLLDGLTGLKLPGGLDLSKLLSGLKL